MPIALSPDDTAVIEVAGRNFRVRAMTARQAARVRPLLEAADKAFAEQDLAKVNDLAVEILGFFLVTEGLPEGLGPGIVDLTDQMSFSELWALLVKAYRASGEVEAALLGKSPLPSASSTGPFAPSATAPPANAMMSPVEKSP